MKPHYYMTLLAIIALALTACDNANTDTPAEETGDETAENANEEDADAADEEADQEDAAGEGTDEGDEEEGAAEEVSFDCDSVEFIVPYSPGGGSDQQVRRLESKLSDYLDANINVVYREGADGAVGWQALHGAEPDGCTVSNVVYPNIVLASMEDDIEFESDDFTHLGQTEVAPQTIAVALESEYETIEDFLAAAEADPGSVTLAGTGRNGEVTREQVEEAAGVEFSYVPVEGGVGDTVPLLAGGHADAGVFGSNHVEQNSDTIRALAIAGDEPAQSENLADAPTLEGDIGLDGVDFATSWGVLGPPGMDDDVAQTWNDALQHALDDDEFVDTLVSAGLTPLFHDLDDANEWNRGVMETLSNR